MLMMQSARRLVRTRQRITKPLLLTLYTDAGLGDAHRDYNLIFRRDANACARRARDYAVHILYCVLIYGYDFITFHEKQQTNRHHRHTTDALLPAGRATTRPAFAYRPERGRGRESRLRAGRTRPVY